MKKIFKELNKDGKSYDTPIELKTYHIELSWLWTFLCSWGKSDANTIYGCPSMSWESLSLTKTADGKMVYLWSWEKLKQQGTVEGLTTKEQKEFDDAYNDYVEKRDEDMPKLYMAIENYVDIVHKWKDIVLNYKYQYIVISQDDTGYVDLVGKNELSYQDLEYLQIEHPKFFKYVAAYMKHIELRASGAYSDTYNDDLWYSPESSEFEDDWKKYIDMTDTVEKKE